MIDVDKVWSRDITYLQIGAKNHYLCVVLDRVIREVLGRSLSDNIAVEHFWRTYKHDCFLINEVNSL